MADGSPPTPAVGCPLTTRVPDELAISMHLLEYTIACAVMHIPRGPVRDVLEKQLRENYGAVQGLVAQHCGKRSTE